ncbi:MAG: hypothetical protein M1836_006736 [Candelina mexicana]|nr:MAG: hypothetical protein M1836_006736 [Candelina mexicana]
MSSKQQKPCFAFGRGQCKYGDRCHYSHALVGGRPRPSLPCRFFTTREGCKRGEECTYSHDNPGQGSSTVTQPQASQEDTKVEQKFREWRYQIQKSSTDRQLRNALGRFFATGRDILVAGGPSTKQQIITQLATEGGLYRVKELTDRCSIAETDPQLFENALLPFFQTLTHPNVASSLILEAPLDTIHNFLFGTGGRRGVALFKFTTRNLSDISAEDDNGKSIAVALVACLGVLQKIIDLNGTAQVMEDFHPVVEVMSACLGDTSKEANLSVQSARHNLSRIKARLGLGTSMPSAGTKPQSDGKAQATFLLRQELPGLLCSEGPRHDNDHENICDITILPTAQEIQSHRLEYLPVKDQAHSPGIPGLLDRQFRLLREDTVGQLRDAVRLEIERLQGIDGSEALPKSQQGARTIVHHHVQLRDLTIDKRNGLHIVAEFDQPANLGKASFKERSEWWQHCKQLQIDSLLCLADSDGGSIFLSVCARNEKPQNQYAIPSDTTDILRVDSDRKGKQTAIKQGSETADWRANDRLNNNYVQLGPPQSLSDNPTRAVITLRLAEMNKRNVIQLQQRYNSGHSGPQSLVEFPGILLPSFRPTLIALQQMSRRGDLPFSEFIAPTVETPGMMHVPPPAYSLQTGFRFKLGAVTNGEDLSLSPNERFDFQTLNQNSTLDDAQQVAFVDALTRRLALIQGPPGTGKSFTGVALVKVLLQNREEAALGPIICVCFTNHALDQLLEQLLAHGVEQLIRMGSRSQSESLQELNLRNIAQKADETKTEKHTRFLCQQKLAEQIQEIELLLTDLKHSNSVASIRKHLQEHYYQHYQELFGEDEDGWQTVHHRPENIITDWIRRGSFQHHRRTVRHVEELLEAQLEEISAAERECLHQHWIFEITSELQEYLLSSLESYRLTKEELDHCHQELNLRCLQQAHVIGVTTSGLARNMDLLRRLNSKVLLCEEAGEVLEAHTLTALLPSIQHAILIGDHEQLRPQIQNYELQHDNPRGEKFSLDISLFERLVRLNNGSQIPFSTLQTQRRMHPSIADLVRNTIYPHLLDYPAVHDYPKVLGLRKRRFWLDHQEPEAGADTSQPTSVSKSNDFEVEMTAALVSHLVRQGIYQSDDIAVLTPYLGQLQKLRKRLSSSFEIVVGDRDAEELEREGLETTSQNPGVKAILAKAFRFVALGIQISPSKSQFLTTLSAWLQKADAMQSASFDCLAGIHVSTNVTLTHFTMLLFVLSHVRGQGRSAIILVPKHVGSHALQSASIQCGMSHYHVDTSRKSWLVGKLEILQSAPRSAISTYPAVTCASGHARTARSRPTRVMWGETTGLARRLAAGTFQLANTAALDLATQEKNVRPAKPHARCSAVIPSATRNVESLARPVHKPVLGLVHIVADASYHVLCLAT